jgi:hypothetical protein
MDGRCLERMRGRALVRMGGIEVKVNRGMGGRSLGRMRGRRLGRMGCRS